MQCLRGCLLVVTLAGCSPRTGEDLGSARQGLLPGFSVGDVQIDPETYHWSDPSTLLTSAEGAGPRTLDVSVSDAVAPQIMLTGTYTPTNSDISKALGYDVTETVQLTAETSVLVPVDAYARVSAYPTWQKATWVVLGPVPYPYGGGTVYKPIGVYFATCGCIGPDPCGTDCASNFPYGAGAPPDPGPAPALDAGAGAGTARDGG
jgi:hypothetical protein